MRGERVAVNKIVYGGKTLIDLTGDTVNEDTLLKGYTAHKADGSVVRGQLFEDYPETVYIYEELQDSNGNDILDSSDKTIQGRTAYRKV